MKKIEKQLALYMDYGKRVQNLTAQSLRGREYVIHRFARDTKIRRIEDVSNKIIDEWVSKMIEAGNKGSTINGRLRLIIAMMTFFKEYGVVVRGYNRKLVRKAKENSIKRVFYEEKQIEKVLAISDDFEWLLISLCFRCGFRLSEITCLRLSDLDGRCIRFIGKGRKDREVWISEEIHDRLENWIVEHKVTDWLWASSKKEDEHFSTAWIRLVMRKAFKKAGVPGFYPHALRHSFATNICNNGASLAIAQKMLGHSQITTTEIYVHSFDGRMEELFGKYSLT